MHPRKAFIVANAIACSLKGAEDGGSGFQKATYSAGPWLPMKACHVLYVWYQSECLSIGILIQALRHRSDRDTWSKDSIDDWSNLHRVVPPHWCCPRIWLHRQLPGSHNPVLINFLALSVIASDLQSLANRVNSSIVGWTVIDRSSQYFSRSSPAMYPYHFRSRAGG